MTEIKEKNIISEKTPTKITIAAGPVIIRNNQVLLSKEIGDKEWKFPGGKITTDLSLKDTVLRELKEETGLACDLLEEPIIYNVIIKKPDKHILYILFHFVGINPKGRIQPQDPEIEKATYFKINDLPVDLAPNIKPVIKEVLKRLNSN